MNKGTSGFVYVKLGVVFAVLCIALFGFSRVSVNNAGVEASAFGPSASHTNAPGEDNCTACHTSFPLNSGTGNLSISGLPPNYRPGQQVPVTVTVNDADALVYGSQTTAIDASGQAAGTFTPPPGNPQTMQVIVGLIGGHQRDYIEHTVEGIIPTTQGTKSWTFTWTAPAQRVGKISFYTASNAANGFGNTTDDYIYATSAATLSGSALSNFDNDGKSDVSVWRPSSGIWFSINSSDGNPQAIQWGAPADKIVPGDYDGDGKTDFAVWRPSTGTWFVIKSAGGVAVFNWGTSGDIPVPGDYDGDLKSDFAIFRPSNGFWFINRSSDGGIDVVNWGISTDKIAQGDYDADGRTDIAVYRPSSGQWFVLKSSTSSPAVFSWGLPTDIPVQGDYDSDGKTDVAVYRPSDGTWYVFRSSDGGVNVTQWGVSSDTPVPADYDGDGKTDFAVYRTGTWFVLRSSDSSADVLNWGTIGDVPIPTGYISQ